jgi:DNA repair exonuclease SbcCD ATPase subunit
VAASETNASDEEEKKVNALRTDYRDYEETDDKVVEFRSAVEANNTLRSIFGTPKNAEFNDIEAVATLLSRASNAIDEVRRQNKDIETSASAIIVKFKKQALEAKDKAEILHDEIDGLKRQNDNIRCQAKVRIGELESALKTLRSDLERITQERDKAMHWLENFRSQVADLLTEAPPTVRPNWQTASSTPYDAA